MNREFFKCADCETIFEVASGDVCAKCSGEKLTRVIPNSVDAALEKHVPIVEYTDEGVVVRVGSEPHPMEESHYIQWIEIVYGDRQERKYLAPGDKPEASFRIASKDVVAYIYCNLHGLWVSGK